MVYVLSTSKQGLSFSKWKKVDMGRSDDISPWSHTKIVGDPFESPLHVSGGTYKPTPLVTIRDRNKANEFESLSSDFLAPLPLATPKPLIPLPSLMMRIIQKMILKRKKIPWNVVVYPPKEEH